MEREVKGLYFGIDIEKNTTSISYFDTKLGLPKNVVENENLYNPCPIDMWNLDEKKASVMSHIKNVAKKIKIIAQESGIARITVTLSLFEKEILDLVVTSMMAAGIKRDLITCISHDEAFTYYAYSQKSNLTAGGVMMLDLSEDGLYAMLMSTAKVEKTTLILEKMIDSKDQDIVQAGKREIALSSVSDKILEKVMPLFSLRTVSSVYLSGTGFSLEDFPKDFTKVLTNHRRVFAGQNIYVKGACYAALAGDGNQRLQLAVKHRITSGVEVEIVERGSKKRFRVLYPCQNWYQAKRSIDVIIDDLRSIDVFLIPCDGSTQTKYKLDISDIPYRDGKRIRLRINFECSSDKVLNMEVKDLGFGEIVKSSGVTVKGSCEI